MPRPKPDENGPARNGGKSWREWRADIDTRLRRLELLMAALVVAVGTPKLGGPGVPDAVSAISQVASDLLRV